MVVKQYYIHNGQKLVVINNPVVDKLNRSCNKIINEFIINI